ncbi:2-keto-4-pentenoate hydratase (plasmid) [Mycobacterium europaeum]|uniref:2-keto-4-pentenoate hydratase n=2 Tax=Mycobacterium TaxID=1763 RepID=A0A1X0KM23_MYCSC|nr:MULTISPECIES: 2-keto-4-pentenoate hydratase [Mycobacterium]KLO45859.1 2-keto-4-pentenoate hydratase [Mycobacterium nebraskense]MCA2262876.1 2-keto-4-pentenoate hydratase [Mycobacterium marseillense]MEA1161206.1 2-keto-4-pentenoate hydratase [Mycobacterium europaeum]ORB75694.1 2-keto-4-pentenoate hydratase [Mycobacterium scrofulaceum]ORW23726.1 2-keto-4-pentenoate hydratase [Mycobacterium nebraskense]
MRTEECHQMAEELLAAYQTRSPIAPLTDRFPDLTVAEGFDIQRAQVDRWMAEGRIIKGHKVGLTSAAMQRQMGVNQPDFGVLHDQMFHPESDPIPVTAFLQPRVEPEIALVIKRDLAGPGVTVAEALAAVDFVLPALEIIDSRIADWRISVADTVADNASSGGVVLGGRPVRPTDADLRLLGCNLYCNGEVVATGAGGAALGSPVISLAWLANTLGQQNDCLRTGDVVLPGSVTAAQPVRPGDVWTAQFAQLGLVTTRFAAGES